MSQFTKHCVRFGATTVLAALLSAGLSLPSQAAGMWKVNTTKSTFSAGSNTIVLNRYSGDASASANDKAGTGTFLVVAGGKIYLARDETADGASSKSLRTVDYSHWQDMKLIEIGSDVRSNDICGFRCQQGLPDPRMTLTFKATHGNPKDRMNDLVVFNK